MNNNEKNQDWVVINHKIYEITGFEGTEEDFQNLLKGKEFDPEDLLTKDSDEDGDNDLKELVEKFYIGKVVTDKKTEENIHIIEKVKNEPADVGFGQSLESLPAKNPRGGIQVSKQHAEQNLKETSMLGDSPKPKKEKNERKVGMFDYLSTGVLLGVVTTISVGVIALKKLKGN